MLSVNLNYFRMKANLNYYDVKRCRSQLFNTQVVVDSITIRFPVSEAVLVLKAQLLFGLQPASHAKNQERKKRQNSQAEQQVTAASKDGRVQLGVRACQPGRHAPPPFSNCGPGVPTRTPLETLFAIQKVECVRGLSCKNTEMSSWPAREREKERVEG